MLELFVMASLSGDAKLCPDHAPRLQSIAGALEQRPTDATLYYWEASTWADCGQVASALAALDLVRKHGDGFLPIRAFGFERIWDDAGFQARRAAFEEALPRVATDAKVAFRAEGKRFIPEGVAYDSKSQALFLGSLIENRILRVRASGQDVFAPSDEMDSVLGLAIDVDARRLYAVTSNQVYPKKDETPRNRVLVFDLDDSKLIRTLAAEGAGQLNDVATRDGTVYVTDSRTGAIYTATPTAGALEEFIAPGTLPAANGVALGSADVLFVAHGTGIAKVDIPKRTVARVANPTRETIAAIDGLYFHRGTLLGIQNATHPGRVIQISLDADASQVTNVRTLLSHHHPMLDEPTTGALDGNRLLVLANSHIGLVDDTGTLPASAETRDPVILDLPLSP